MAETATAAPAPSRKEYLHGPSLLAWLIVLPTHFVLPMVPIFLENYGLEIHSTWGALGIVGFFLSFLSLLRAEVRRRSGLPVDLDLLPAWRQTVVATLAVFVTALVLATLAGVAVSRSSPAFSSATGGAALVLMAAWMSPVLPLTYLGAPALLALFEGRPTRQVLRRIAERSIYRLVALCVLVWGLVCCYYSLVVANDSVLLLVLLFLPVVTAASVFVLWGLAALLASLAEVPKASKAGEEASQGNLQVP